MRPAAYVMVIVAGGAADSAGWALAVLGAAGLLSAGGVEGVPRSYPYFEGGAFLLGGIAVLLIASGLVWLSVRKLASRLGATRLERKRTPWVASSLALVLSLPIFPYALVLIFPGLGK